jgi:hypothetical protein
MPDDAVPPAASAPAPAEPPVRRRGFFRRHWLGTLVAAAVFVPLLVFTIWAGGALAFSYSESDRIGYVQKFGKKGWLCKTWEGELQLSTIPGSAPTIWHFSVRDDSIAQEIVKTEGKQVSLHYEQKVAVPTSCFGETEYFITGVRLIR